MGYTHYWDGQGSKRDASKFANFAKVAKRAIELAISRGIELGDAWGENVPKIDDTIVAFNGVGEDSHESCIIEPEQTGFEFCKTAYKPYDVVVVAVLVLYKHFFPEIVLSSDGELGDLIDGVILAGEALGEDLEIFQDNRRNFGVRKAVAITA